MGPTRHNIIHVPTKLEIKLFPQTVSKTVKHFRNYFNFKQKDGSYTSLLIKRNKDKLNQKVVHTHTAL